VNLIDGEICILGMSFYSFCLHSDTHTHTHTQRERERERELSIITITATTTITATNITTAATIEKDKIP